VKNRGMDRKIKVLALISIVIAASVAASLMFALQSIAKADPTNVVGSDEQPTLPSVNGVDNSSLPVIGDNGPGPRMGGFGFGGPGGFCGMGGFGGPGRMGGFGFIQVSSDFTQNATNIAKADADVQNLLNNGYNITSVRPVITTTVDGNGNLVTKATTANLTLQSTTGRALVVVDLSQAKVTKIVTLTRTEIDK